MKRCLAFAVMIAVQGTPGAAQEKDTASARPAGGHLGIALGLAAATATGLFVPPLVVLVRPDSNVKDTAGPALRSTSIMIYGSVGLTGLLQPGKGGANWAASAGAQVHYRSLFAEARVDEQGVDRAYQLQSVQVGYLFFDGHPRAAAGLSVGVQRIRDDRSRDGIAVGLPLVGFGPRSIRVRLEPRYVFSPVGTEWHWRGELLGPITQRSPLIVGGSFDIKPIPQHGPYHVILSFIVGVRP